MWNIIEAKRKWWVLAAMATSLALVFIDQTAVAVALPQMQRQLNASSTLLQWIVNSYLLTLAALIILGGKIGDRIGHRQTFLMGVIVFIVASVSCGFAVTGWWVVLSRVLQGIGGAFMIPAAAPLLYSVFAANERGKAMGLYVGISAIFLALGTPLGGVIIQWLSWRWVFWINVPIALISIILTLVAVPKVAPARATERLDWWGFILSGVSIVSLVLGFMESAQFGWSSRTVWGLLLLGVVSAALFIRRDKHIANPFVELSLFKTGVFPHATMILILMQAVFGVFIFWMIFILNVLQYSPSAGGLLLLPATLPIIFMAPIGGHLRDRFGPKRPLCLGAALVTIGLLWVGFTAPLKDYLWLLPGFLLLGLAAPLVMSNCMTSAINSIAPPKRGVATGVLNAARQLGSAVGITYVGTLITVFNDQQLVNFIQHTDGGIAQLQVKQIDGLLVNAPTALQATAHLTSVEIRALYQAANHAYTYAFSWSMIFVAGLAFIALLIGLRLPATPPVSPVKQ